jgi:hypothetical protein
MSELAKSVPSQLGQIIKRKTRSKKRRRTKKRAAKDLIYGVTPIPGLLLPPIDRPQRSASNVRPSRKATIEQVKEVYRPQLNSAQKGKRDHVIDLSNK